MPQSTIIHNWRNGFYFCSKHLTFSGGKCHEPYMNTRRIMIIVYYNNKAWKTCTSKLVGLHSFLVPFKQSMCCIAFAVTSVSSPARWTRGKKKYVWPSRAYLPKVGVSEQKHSSVAKTVVNPWWRQYWKRTLQRYPHPSVPETSRWLVVPRVAWSPYGTRSSADRKITWWGKKHIQLAADEDWNKPKNNG